MAHLMFGDVLQNMRRIWAAQAARDLSDGELVQRFLDFREETAFAVLMHRHGPMVLGVCRRATGDLHTAEDCFQGTFLVLARRAASIRKKSSIASWLCGVAQRIALRAKKKAKAQHDLERRFAHLPRTGPVDDVTWHELRTVLDEEIANLAEKYRAPLILCYLEGKSHDQAAKELGWPKNTVTNRLIRGRDLLRQQLVKRSIALSAAAISAMVSQKAAAAPVGALLMISTARAAIGVAAGETLAGACLSASAAALAKEAMPGILGVKAVLALVLMIGVAVSGAGVLVFGVPAEIGKETQSAKTQPPKAKIDEAKGLPNEVAQSAFDFYGDPLPEGALARLGTVRFRHPWRTFRVAYSPDGKVLATASAGTFGVHLWDASTGRPLHRFTAPRVSQDLAFSPDGLTLFTNNLSLIEVAKGREIRRLSAPDGFFAACVAFSPDGRTVAAADKGPFWKVVLWDALTGKELFTLKDRLSARHEGNWRAVAFSSDGKYLATGTSGSKEVMLWEVATGKELRRLEVCEGGVWSVAFSPSGKILAAAGVDGLIRRWNFGSGELMPGASTGKKSYSTVFSPNGEVLACVGEDGTILLLDPAMGKELRQWQAHGPTINGLAFSPDGKVLVSVGASGTSTIRRWNTASGQEIDPPAGHTARVDMVQFGADNKKLNSLDKEGRLMVWDLGAGGEGRQLLTGSPGWSPLDLSPDGKTVARAEPITGEQQPKGVIDLWDAATGKITRSLTGNRVKVEAVKLSSNSKILAASTSSEISWWDIASGKRWQVSFEPQSRGDAILAFSPDSKLMVRSKFEARLYLYDVASGKELRSWDCKDMYTRAIAFSPDGASIATGHAEGSVHVWDTATGREIWQLNAQQEPFHTMALAFSPSGRILASAEYDFRQLPGDGKNRDMGFVAVIRMWDMFSGQQIRKIDMPQGYITSLAVAHDGRTIATGGGDSTILLWDLTGQSKTPRPASAPLTANKLNTLWADLAGDAAQADRAIWTLAFAPKSSLPFLKKQMQPPPSADRKEIAKLVNALDSERFADRQKAVQSLEQLGKGTEAALRSALEGRIALEVRQRIEQILERREKLAIPMLRAVEVLEQIGTPEAQQLLQDLVRSASNPRVAQAAASALSRRAAN